MNTEEISNKIVRKIKRKGVVCRIIGLSDSGSFYIHLKCNKNGIRVSNHKENDGLKYKYNIRTDIIKDFITGDNRYYWNADNLSKAINFILREEKIKYGG